MKLLVTGGCGFIGSHFIRLMLKNDPQATIINIDALTYAAHPDMSSELEDAFGSRYRLVQENIVSVELKEILEGNPIEAVVNFAAESHVDRSILDPGVFIRTNTVGAEHLMREARGLGRVRFVHVSTDEVYGSLHPGDAAFTETSPLDPNSPYAASKAAADLLLLASGRTYGQEILITRCTNNYGPYQFPEKLVPLLIANALEDKTIPVYGDGMQVRDWIYVEDHCRGIEAVLRRGVPGEVYNISANEERANLEVVKAVLTLLEKPHSLIQHVGDRPAHDRRYGLNAEKIRRELGWKPRFTFEEGFKKTIEWYTTHQEWWKKVRNQNYQDYYSANYEKKFATTGEKTA